MSDTKELLRSKHAFGNSNSLNAALEAGKIDAFDVLFLDGDTNPKIGWIDRNGNPVIVETGENDVVRVEALPESGEEGKIYIFGEDGYFWDGTKFINLCKPTDVTELESSIATLNSLIGKKADAEEVEAKVNEVKEDAIVYTDEKVEDVLDEVDYLYSKVKYEIGSKPEGTLVSYREKEIRVMCPSDTKWVKQSVGSTGNANMYYMSFKAYAPEGAVSFKEGDKGVVIDEMYTFDDDFAGTDEFGRNYSICWLALASYDEASDTWNYFGKNSSFDKYIGWTYCVEWYDANGVIIESDNVRINLSNESCHSEIKPFYMADISKEIESKIEEKIAEVESAYEVIEF